MTTITDRAADGGVRITLAGNVGPAEARTIERHALSLIREGCRRLEIAFDDVSVDPGSLILLSLRPQRWMSRRGGMLQLLCSDGEINSALAGTGLVELIDAMGPAL